MRLPARDASRTIPVTGQRPCELVLGVLRRSIIILSNKILKVVECCGRVSKKLYCLHFILSLLLIQFTSFLPLYADYCPMECLFESHPLFHHGREVGNVSCALFIVIQWGTDTLKIVQQQMRLLLATFLYFALNALLRLPLHRASTDLLNCNIIIALSKNFIHPIKGSNSSEKTQQILRQYLQRKAES